MNQLLMAINRGKGRWSEVYSKLVSVRGMSGHVETSKNQQTKTTWIQSELHKNLLSSICICNLE